MIGIEILVGLADSFFCFVMAYWSILFYIRRHVNFEYCLHWGLANFFEGISYILVVFFNIVPFSFMYVYILYTALAYILKVHALSYIRITCDLQHKCKYCKKKAIRLAKWLESFILLTGIALFAGFSGSYQVDFLSKTELNIFFIASCCVSSIILYISTKSKGYFKLLRIGFGLLFIANSLLLVNVLRGGVKLLTIFEWSLRFLYMVCTFFGVSNIATFRDRGKIM